MVAPTDKIKRLLPILLKKLGERGVPVECLILYGSYAHGKPAAYSDIDLAVISPAFEGKGILQRQELLGEALWDIREPIEALGYSPKEYKQPLSFSFLSEIISTGELIYKA